MNFIEALLEDIAEVSASEVIDVAMERWGEVDYSLSEEENSHYPDFINDLLHIAYLDKAVHLEGLEFFITSVDKSVMQSTINAFRKINDHQDADILQNILQIREVQKMYAGKVKNLSESTSCKIFLFETLMYFNLKETNMWELLEDYLEKKIYTYSQHTRSGWKN